MNHRIYPAILVAAVALAGGCATDRGGSENYGERAAKLMQQSFKTNGQANIDRLQQDDLQRTCGETAGRALAGGTTQKVAKEQLATVKYPADGKYLGDFKAGEAVAQRGSGLQWSDAPGSAAGGNCYACHQLSGQEISYGNLGPSLHRYGKIRGNSEATVKYTWAKIYNAKAYNACSTMPRFGHKGILTEQQIQDVMALLLDPRSPVNQ